MKSIHTHTHTNITASFYEDKTVSIRNNFDSTVSAIKHTDKPIKQHGVDRKISTLKIQDIDKIYEI